MGGFGLGAVVRHSFSRTEEVLFKPFSAKKWLRLLLTAFLAGALGYSGVGRGIGNSLRDRKAAKTETKTSGAAPSQAAAPAAAGGAADLSSRAKGFMEKLPARLQAHRTGIAAAALILLLIMILFLWIASRFQFVWLNAVRENSAEISGPFDAFAKSADSLFFLRLGLMLAGLFLLSGLGGGAFLSLRAAGVLEGKAGFLAILWAAAPWVALLFTAGVLHWIFHTLLEHFVVPIMAMDDVGVREAIPAFVGVLKGRVGRFLLYLLAWVGLRILAGIAVAAAGVLLLLTLLLAGAILFGLAYLLVAKLLGLKILFIVIAVLAGVPFAVLSLALVVSIQLPPAVFFRSFSLYFMTSLDCGRAPLLPAAPE